MVSDDFGLGHTLPFGGSQQVLRLHERVTKEAVAAHHLDEALRGHGVPFPTLIHHEPVVDLLHVSFRQLHGLLYRGFPGALTRRVGAMMERSLSQS